MFLELQRRKEEEDARKRAEKMEKMAKEKELKEERKQIKNERDRERQKMRQDIMAKMRAGNTKGGDIKVELVGVPSFMQEEVNIQQVPKPSSSSSSNVKKAYQSVMPAASEPEIIQGEDYVIMAPQRKQWGQRGA